MKGSEINLGTERQFAMDTGITDDGCVVMVDNWGHWLFRLRITVQH